jgi:Right handed beta helix region
MTGNSATSSRPRLDRRSFLKRLGVVSGYYFLSARMPAATGLALSQSTVVVSEPTGDAIQAAINSLTSGGTVMLVSRKPYLLSQPLIIQTDNIELVGQGTKHTRLRAKPGAVFTNSFHSEEYLVLIQSVSGGSIQGLTVDAANEDNGGGVLRVGIGVWDSSSVQISSVNFVRNLGPNGFNRALNFNQSSNVTAQGCNITQSRDGVLVYQCDGFQLDNCSVSHCQVFMAKSFTSVISGLDLISSSNGSITSCYVHNNTVPGGVFVTDCTGILIDSSRVEHTLPYSGQPGNDGIFIQLCPDGPVTVQNCSLEKNSGAGVSAQGSSNVVIQGCTIKNSGTPAAGGSGVSINGGTSNVQVTGNTVTDSRHPPYGGIIAGFSDSSDSNGTIQQNVVHGFAQGVALGSNSISYDVTNNDLRGNKECVLDQGTSNTVSGNTCT